MTFYILKDKNPVPCPDVIAWAEWFEQNPNRIVKQDMIGYTKVSTVFLGVDHSHGIGSPLLFETMVFHGAHDGYQTRCTTWVEAEQMHEAAVRMVETPGQMRR